MRFGFSDGSCGSVRGSWRFQSPSPKTTHFGASEWPRSHTGEYIHNSGVLGPEACETGTPTRGGGEGPPTRRSTQFGILGPEPSGPKLPNCVLPHGAAVPFSQARIAYSSAWGAPPQQHAWEYLFRKLQAPNSRIVYSPAWSTRESTFVASFRPQTPELCVGGPSLFLLYLYLCSCTIRHYLRYVVAQV